VTVPLQEVYELEGFIPWCSDEIVEAGHVFEENYQDGIVPIGTRVAVVGPLSREDAFTMARKYGWSAHSDYKYFYKTIAE
jgi:hypothetical protein